MIPSSSTSAMCSFFFGECCKVCVLPSVIFGDFGDRWAIAVFPEKELGVALFTAGNNRTCVILMRMVDGQIIHHLSSC